MKHAVIALACAFAASAALAQAPSAAPAASAAPAVDMPKPTCDPVPEYPGRLAMTTPSRRSAFERDLKKYEVCLKAFLEERKAIIKANENGANAAIEAYNAVVEKIRQEQEAARQ